MMPSAIDAPPGESTLGKLPHTSPARAAEPSHAQSSRSPRRAAVHRWWIGEDGNYDHIIAINMNMSWWGQFKVVFKLSNNLALPGRGNKGYDPASKYDLIFRTLCHNMNCFMLKAELDPACNDVTHKNCNVTHNNSNRSWHLFCFLSVHKIEREACHQLGE